MMGFLGFFLNVLYSYLSIISLLSNLHVDVDRDAYGFALRPQHLQRYRECCEIYKEEEEERTHKWKQFLEQQKESSLVWNVSSSKKSVSDGSTESDQQKEVLVEKEPKAGKVRKWARIRLSLSAIESTMSLRIKERKNMKDEQIGRNHLPSIEEDFEEVLSFNLISDDSGNESLEASAAANGISPEPFFPWKEELVCLVRGGLPKALRGEVWQAFVGARKRRMERYYQNLIASETNAGEGKDYGSSLSKWRRQIEKDLPRTFPGHPALDEVGRDSLRRLLLAYAQHNPSVGYCQAMNFFAGLLLLLMPEENAFWTLVGILDDYFDGYYSEEMIESQVDQLVFEELMRERFPKLVSHLDCLGVQVAWISGPWFLSIFVNIIPWESVLRVWDVLLFEGNRVMLFRTALALMELYGHALVTTKDAGDAITLLQSFAGSTFDSSQLVLTACMGYLAVTEARLQELRKKHRPAVLGVIEERSKEGRVWKDSKGSGDNLTDGDQSPSANLDVFLKGLTVNSEGDSVPDLQEQVVWLKVELCRLLEEKRSATLRAEELETALMEMVMQDNRRQLSAKVEQLEKEVTGLRQLLTDKQEQEKVMLQVLMRVEQEQRVTEDARVSAEQDAAAQRYVVNVLQEKYEKATASLAQMEERVVMAETMLEATLQYQSGQVKALSSPRYANQDSAQNSSMKRISLLSRPFGLGWRDRNKGKPTNVEESSESKSTHEEEVPNILHKETNGSQ
ncbi:unnamed protein product, partial [Vitis vinifera]